MRARGVMLGQGELDECFVQAALSFLRTACHYFSPRARAVLTLPGTKLRLASSEFLMVGVSHARYTYSRCLALGLLGGSDAFMRLPLNGINKVPETGVPRKPDLRISLKYCELGRLGELSSKISPGSRCAYSRLYSLESRGS